MTYDYLIGLFMFCLVMSVTPGPNNIMLMASGMNYGVKRTLPHAAGIQFGWPLMILLVGLGLGQVFERFPTLLTVLKIISAIYMLWLAWKIATASAPKEAGASAGKPMTFLQAALFQWVNGKAWMMALATISAYTIPGNFGLSVAAVVIMYFLTGFVSTAGWVGFGTALRAFLTDERWRKWINAGLAAALVLSLWPMLRH
jgi:threonine/homoserine/homoserine lactone efflux protein